MSSPTNLTDSLTRLRERKHRASKQSSAKAPKKPKRMLKVRGRGFAKDYFVIFAYALLATAILTQLVLIVWLDIV